MTQLTTSRYRVRRSKPMNYPVNTYKLDLEFEASDKSPHRAGILLRVEGREVRSRLFSSIEAPEEDEDSS